jgi:hypothetical protein
MSTLFYVTVFHALGVYSTPWSHRVEEGPHPIEVLQVQRATEKVQYKLFGILPTLLSPTLGIKL